MKKDLDGQITYILKNIEGVTRNDIHEYDSVYIKAILGNWTSF